MTAVPASYDMSGSYPIGLDVDGPQKQQVLSVLLRIIFAIPALVFAMILGFVLGIVTVIAWVVILITGKYPAGMMNFAEGSLRAITRAQGYAYLMTDKMPGFSLDDDSAYPVRLSVHGQLDGRNRLTVFFRYLAAIPHLIILGALNYVMGVVMFVAWVIALVKGELPLGLHNFIAGYLRWSARVGGYTALLTDEYPPFSLT